jgi:DNA processing protein
MELMDELTAWLTLVRAPGLHSGTLVPLLQQFPDVAALVSSSPATQRACGLDPKLIDWLQAPPQDAIARDLRWLERDAHHFIPRTSPRYPRLLGEVSDAPVGLYVRGDPTLLAGPQLAMVGSRNPTPAGREIAYSFAALLTQCGLTITSGLALGIDTSCHQGALDVEGTTIAVCGTGLDIVYPRSNQKLADAIVARGALVSEFALGTAARKEHFPRRNRVISGLSLGTLVVEAALQSGSLITARLAAEQGREVFAIPGSINNPLASGCHRLIQNGAKLVTNSDDIVAELPALAAALADSLGRAATDATHSEHARTAPSSTVQWPDVSRNMSASLDKDYEILLDALGFEPAGVDLLVERTGLRADEVASMLLLLELARRIESYPGGLYVRARPKAVK